MMLLINQVKRADGWHTSKWELKHVTRAEPDPALFKYPSVDKNPGIVTADKLAK